MGKELLDLGGVGGEGFSDERREDEARSLQGGDHGLGGRIARDVDGGLICSC